jgi:hypothetical protein
MKTNNKRKRRNKPSGEFVMAELELRKMADEIQRETGKEFVIKKKGDGWIVERKK